LDAVSRIFGSTSTDESAEVEIKKEVCFKLHKYDVEKAKHRLNGENVYGKHGR
jgi:hypothetical protein